VYTLLVHGLVASLLGQEKQSRCVHIFPFALYTCFAIEKVQKYFKDFMGISSTNSLETSLVYLGQLRGLKGLLHTLNSIMIPTKVS